MARAERFGAGRFVAKSTKQEIANQQREKRMSTQPPAVQIPAQLVKELRERTGAGFSDCRAALVEAGGDIEKAISILRKKGQAAAAKKAQREASEGLVGSYIHAGGKIGVLVEMNCESDFVARTDAFQQLSHDIAMHIAALDPRYVRREEVTQEMLEKERDIYKAQALATGKPEAVVEKIVNGKMEKFYEENCLYEQHYIKDESVTISEMIAQAVIKLGENISIRRFVRFKVGEVSGGAAGPETAPVPAPVNT
jgi:elongation factor Ts